MLKVQKKQEKEKITDSSSDEDSEQLKKIINEKLEDFRNKKL